MSGYVRIGPPLGSAGVVKVALGRFAALCQGEVHAKSCKSHSNGGVKVALGGKFAALC